MNSCGQLVRTGKIQADSGRVGYAMKGAVGRLEEGAWLR
jgi:hypothetical protein